MVSGAGSPVEVDEMDGCRHNPHLEGSSQQPPLPDGADRQGQSSHVEVAATDSPIAAQNACPNESSAQAMQLAGSPEHVAEDPIGRDDEGADIGNTGLKFDIIVRRRRGTGG